MSLKIEPMPLDDIQEAPRNPKLHSDQIEASISRFGFVEPIILDERTGRIVAGHGRRAALMKLKSAGATAPNGVLVDENGRWLIPVVRGWSSRNDSEAESYLIASNRLTELGGWNETELASMLNDLNSADLLSGIGYESEDVDKIMREIDQAQLLREREGIEESPLNAVWQIVIDCSTESEQEKYLNEFIERGLKCRALIL